MPPDPKAFGAAVQESRRDESKSGVWHRRPIIVGRLCETVDKGNFTSGLRPSRRLKAVSPANEMAADA